MPDATMAHAQLIGFQLSRLAVPPESLRDVASRARLVNVINPPIRWDTPGRLQEISTLMTDHLRDVPDVLERLGMALRLWSGCLSAAKMISAETMDGPNTPEGRESQSRDIESTAQGDSLFAAGVEAAPAFKALLGQDYYFAGVPEDSLVRRFPNEFLRAGTGP